jgi:hypothetical protein
LAQYLFSELRGYYTTSTRNLEPTGPIGINMASDVTSKFRRSRRRETAETCENPPNSQEFGYNSN